MSIQEPTISRTAVKNRPNPFKLVRQLHLYLGTFFAPALIFFSLSGALQLFGLHEGRPGSTYQPPAWIETLAQIHKHQTLASPPKRPPSAAKEPPRADQAKPGNIKPPSYSAAVAVLRVFFLLMSLGLIATTCLGIYMAFAFNRSRRLVWSLLVLGTLVPVGLLLV